MRDSSEISQTIRVLDLTPELRTDFRHEDIDTPAKEACAAWERSLRPGQYFSERGDHRPMHHRTQAVQGHPGARAWPRGPDGGAWGPQDLSPIPSEKGFMPLVPSPTASPGKRPRSRGKDGCFTGDGTATDSAAAALMAADAVAAEIGFEGHERETLMPFEPKALDDERLPPPPAPPPFEPSWKAPPPGFDARTLRRQAAVLRGEAAAAHRDEEAVRRSSLRLAEIHAGTVDNGNENASLARERLRCLHAALLRLRGERARYAEAIRAAVAWQESLEDLREKLASSEEQRRSAERVKGDVHRSLVTAVNANRAKEAEVVHIERALEAAWRRDDVAAEIERQSQQEALADAFFRRRRRNGRSNPGARSNSTSGNLLFFGPAGARAGARTAHNSDGGDGDEVGGSRAQAAAAAGGGDDGVDSNDFHLYSSPLLLQTMSWGFNVFQEACRRSRGMRWLAAARQTRAEADRQVVLREALAAWAVGAALERGAREARGRRMVETARLCLARWKIFAALEVRFRAERRRRVRLRVMEALRRAVQEARRDRDLGQRREALVLRRCFRGWRVLRAKSTLTPKELSEKRRAADRHRLGRLFEAWHLAALASSASSTAIVQCVRRRRVAAALTANFGAWASLSRARCWRRRRRLRRGLEALACFPAGAAAGAGGSGLAMASASVLLRRKRRRQQRREFGEHSVAAGHVATADGALGWRGDHVQHVPVGGLEGEGGARGVGAPDSYAVASAHRRRVVLSRGLQAMRYAGAAMLRRSGRLCRVRRRNGEGGVIIVSICVVRMAWHTWIEAVRARRRARHGVCAAAAAWRRKRLVGGLRQLMRFALAATRRRRADRVALLRRTFVAMRQGCSISRRQHSACCAFVNAFASRRLNLLGSAMTRLATAGSGSLPTVVALTVAAAKRRREREALGAAWRCWVGGWLRRQAKESRVRQLQAQRQRHREQDLAEQLAEAQRESAALQQEAAAVETELQRTETLVQEQEAALVASRRSLAEAAAAAAAIKARLGPAAGLKATAKSSKPKGGPKKLGGSAATYTGSGAAGNGVGRGLGGGAGAETRKRRGVIHPPHTTPKKYHSAKDRRGTRTGQLAGQRGAAHVLAEAEARRRAAKKAAVAREKAASTARGRLAGQQEADRAVLEGALDAARRYAEELDRGRARVEEAEREKLRVRAETDNLLEKVELLARKADEEATQGARMASGAESERAALSLEVSKAEARAREMMAILDEREREAAGLRQALAADEAERQAEELDPEREPVPPTVRSPRLPSSPPRQAPPMAGRRVATATNGGPVRGCDVQELKESIALLQEKVRASASLA